LHHGLAAMSGFFRSLKTTKVRISGRFGIRIILSAKTHADFVVKEGFILES
jgi:hypothetical protein